MLKKLVIFVHKWLGVVLALFFLMWFVSGVVLYFVPFPSLTAAERLAALPALTLEGPGCCLAAQDAAQRAGLRPAVGGETRLGMLGDAPVWRLLATEEAVPARAVARAPQPDARPRWRTVDARSGTLLAPLSPDAAARVAEAFSGRRATGTEWVERDQWTVPQGLDVHRPLIKVLLDGDDGLQLYVSPGAAEVVRDTRRAERFWNWVGAVPHWIYPTVLRQFPRAWHHVVVWLSIPGVLLAATGIVLGVWQLFLNRQRWIPYRRFWMRWHHILGLVAAVFTLTWMFSGLMSMNPFGVFGGAAVGPQARALWAGEPAPLGRGPRDAVVLAAAQGMVVQELDLLRIAGQAWYRVRGRESAGIPSQWLVRADGPSATMARALPDAMLRARLQMLRPEAPAPAVEKMEHYDDLYYARRQDGAALHTRPLPVWRARWADDGVAVYADPASGRIVLRTDAGTAWQRVLYHGLHSLDFAPLLARPVLRTWLIVVLSLLGVALCATSCVIAWRVLVPRRRAARAQGPARDAGGAWTA